MVGTSPWLELTIRGKEPWLPPQCMTVCKASMQDGVPDQLPLTGGPAGPLCCCSAARGEESMAVIMIAVEVGSSSSSRSATPAHALHAQCTSRSIGIRVNRTICTYGASE